MTPSTVTITSRSVTASNKQARLLEGECAMAGRKFTQEKRLRYVRWRVLCDLLYNKSHIRPEANVVLTSPTKLTKSCQSKAHRVADSLQWLLEMGYIKNLEWGYGRVRVEINATHLQIETEGKTSAPSDCALDGGTENIIVQPLPHEEVEVKYYRSGMNPKVGLKLPTTFPEIALDGDTEITYEEYHELMEAQIKEGESACEIQPEQETDLKEESKTPLKTSISQPQRTSRLRKPSTID